MVLIGKKSAIENNIFKNSKYVEGNPYVVFTLYVLTLKENREYRGGFQTFD